MKYIATIVLAIALLSAHATRDESEEDGLAVEEATSRIVLDSTLSEALANLRAKRARGRNLVYGCRDKGPLKEQGLVDKLTKELVFESAKCVGDGSFGRVFLVKARCSQTFFLAVKEQNFKRNTKTETDKAKESVRHEAEVMYSIKDKHTVRYHGGVFVGSHGYLLMEALPGGELFDTIRNRAVGLPVQLALFAEALSGVVRIHELGYAHLDLKPENIFLTADCTKGECHAKVADFGLSRKADAYGGEVGTPGYMAPEVYDKKSGQKSDVWAMGVVLFEILNEQEMPTTPCQESDRFNDMVQKSTGYTFERGRLMKRGKIVRQEQKHNDQARVGNAEYLYEMYCATIYDPDEAIPKKAYFRDVLVGMLKKDPKQRWSAGKALEAFKRTAETFTDLRGKILVDYEDTTDLPACMGPLA